MFSDLLAGLAIIASMGIFVLELAYGIVGHAVTSLFETLVQFLFGWLDPGS